MFQSNKKVFVLAFILLLSLSLILPGCSGAAPEAPQAPAPAEEQPAEPVEAAAPATGEPIKIGVAGPTTGAAAAYGEVQLNGVQIAVTEINETGGINGRPIELVPGDDQCDPTEAANVAQKFVSDPEIWAVIGHICSSTTLAGGPIYEAAGLTLVTGSSTNPTVTEQGWTHVFRTITSDADQGPEIAKLGIETLGLSKFAILFANHDYGRGLKDYTEPAIQEAGGEVVAVETFAPGETTDFSAQLTKIAEADPDVLVLLTDYAEGGLISGQRMRHGLEDVTVISSAGNAHQDYIDLAGGAPAEGNLLVVYYNADSDDPATVEFNKKYMARWNELPTAEIPVFNYEVVYILKEAIEKGATRETMHEFVRDIEYDGPTGMTKFDEKGQVSGKGQSVIVITNGEFKTFKPGEMAAAPATGEPIKIGVAGPTTGAAAAYGEVQLNGVQIAVTEINETGGINGRPIELVPGDDQCDPTEAANVAQKFVSDPEIWAVIGHICSSTTLAGGPIYEAAGLTLVTGSSTNPTVTEQGWTRVFRTITSDADQGPEIAKLGIETLGLSKFAIMFANHDYGRGLKDYTEPAIEAMGGEVVAVETFAPGETTDFSAQLTKIAEADPDVLVLLTDYAEGGLISGQRMRHGLEDVTVISSAGNAHQDYIDLAGGAPAEGNLMVVYYNADSDDPATVEFNKKYMARWNELPTAEIPVFNYEVVYILKEAIEKGATRDTMHEYVREIEYHGPTGVTKFDEKGHTSGKGQSVIAITNGEFKTFKPGEMAAAAAPATGEPIKIGVAGPTTGAAAAYGEVQLNGVQIAVTEINETGGINGRPIELVPGDDQCDPTEAANVAQRFVSDPEIWAVIGHICSSTTLAGGPIYEAAGLTLVTGSSTNPTVTEQGWTRVFRTITSDADQGPEIAKLGIETLGLSKFAILFANHDYGRGLLDYTEPAIEAMGGEVVAVETFAPGETTDFSAQLTKIAEADPDVLVLLTDYAEGGLISGQRMRHGLEDVTVISSAGNAHQDYIDLAGGEPAEGNLMVVYYNADSDDPATVEFNKKYMARWNELPTAEIPVFNYEVVYILKEAIEKGATRDTMHEFVRDIEYDGPTGVTKFDEKGHTSGKGQSVIVITNGEFKTFKP